MTLIGFHGRGKRARTRRERFCNEPSKEVSERMKEVMSDDVHGVRDDRFYVESVISNFLTNIDPTVLQLNYLLLLTIGQ
jgi:hypothetical protein